jgi:hypothetical protein
MAITIHQARHVIKEEKFKLNVIDYTLVELSCLEARKFPRFLNLFLLKLTMLQKEKSIVLARPSVIYN